MEPSEPRPELTEGQLEQIEDLYRREAGDLYRFACSISYGRESEAGDLVQTTFQDAVRAWRKIGHRGPVEHRKWLRRVLRNKAIDLWRKQKAIALVADVPDLHDDPDEHAELTIALANCWKVIERMPPARRTVASLVWGESWSPTRVAEHLGVASSTVRGHLREARKQLRATIGHLVPFIDDEEEQEPAP